MNNSPAYKTVFLLDCSKYFRSARCGKEYEIDKGRPTNSGNVIGPISKSLYTCAVEAIFEYCRVIWDLFPNGERLIQILCCMNELVKTINSWEVVQQSYENLFDSFYNFGKSSNLLDPKENNLTPNSSIIFLINGFIEALTSLSLPVTNNNNYNPNLTNSVRIILISHFTNDFMVNSFKQEIKNIFEKHNQVLAERQKISSELCEIINHLDVIILNTVPLTKENACVDISNHYLNDNLSFSLHSIYSGPFISTKLTFLAFDHYDLASTTVSGIPMKEEQNAGTSANYDVEIIHPKKAHTQFFNSEEPDIDFSTLLTSNYREGFEFKTLMLKWCTPKSIPQINEFSYCTGAYRITALDVNSRPSSCLINFLHTGKTVNLEIQRAKGQKMFSHMLQCHGGELFIHVLSNARSVIEDPPAISEGVGGRVTDYRINDFADFMKRHRLIKLNNDQNNLEQAKNLLRKDTLYWPVSYGLSVFFNVRDQIHTFYQLISKDKLSNHDEIELKNIIYSLVSSESKGLNLPVQSIIRNKGIKKEDLYRIMWNEMEHVIKCFNETPQHQSVLHCLLDCKPKNDSSIVSHHIPIGNGNISKGITNGTQSFAVASAATTPVVSNKKLEMKINLNNISIGTETLQSLYINKLAFKNVKRRREFFGRTNSEGKIAKLYCELADDK
ncbi:hypothetical protein RDWZM_008737 [Blomia tropicalis]|uniref:Protein asunder n=1 Tax=Blomia tropicalis TaxID=40697 RepID=A0A9Q0M570_BLOTA|nr:hypothetical protein BLOT_004477 [Blomia tropicalis]KAJ6217580.1 hypothetical protein RDWZM_008737 [Blomia tropicalis]